MNDKINSKHRMGRRKVFKTLYRNVLGLLFRAKQPRQAPILDPNEVYIKLT